MGQPIGWFSSPSIVWQVSLEIGRLVNSPTLHLYTGPIHRVIWPVRKDSDFASKVPEHKLNSSYTDRVDPFPSALSNRLMLLLFRPDYCWRPLVAILAIHVLEDFWIHVFWRWLKTKLYWWRRKPNVSLYVNEKENYYGHSFFGSRGNQGAVNELSLKIYNSSGSLVNKNICYPIYNCVSPCTFLGCSSKQISVISVWEEFCKTDKYKFVLNSTLKSLFLIQTYWKFLG